MVEPPVAKFAPCLKFDPNEFKYALKYGNPRRSAANHSSRIKVFFFFFGLMLFESKFFY